MEFRKAKENELREITNIFTEETSKKPYEQQWTKEDAFERMKKISSEENLFVVVSESKVIGLAILLGPKVIKKRVYLNELWISEKYQGKGIGKEFIKFLEKEAKKRGGKMIDIIAHRKAKALKFYNKLGYNQSKDFIFLTKNL